MSLYSAQRKLDLLQTSLLYLPKERLGLFQKNKILKTQIKRELKKANLQSIYRHSLAFVYTMKGIRLN